MPDASTETVASHRDALQAYFASNCLSTSGKIPPWVIINLAEHVDLLRLVKQRFMYKFMPMKTVSVPISEARAEFCQLIEKVKSGKLRVLVTDHGEPKVQILPFTPRNVPWRVAEPDDPNQYGDLPSPIVENWK